MRAKNSINFAASFREIEFFLSLSLSVLSKFIFVCTAADGSDAIYHPNRIHRFRPGKRGDAFGLDSKIPSLNGVYKNRPISRHFLRHSASSF